MDPPNPHETASTNHTMIASTSATNEAFAEHLLALMGSVLPSLDSGTTTTVDEGQVDELMRRHHSRSNAELQVEKAVLEMGKRLRDAEEEVRVLKATNGPSKIDPPVENGVQTPCQTCRRSSRDLPITPMNHLTISRAVPSSEDNHAPMSAETELDLLKAQVQDIARVCKAVALGDLTQKIIVPVKGQEMIELKGEFRVPGFVVRGELIREQRLSIIWWISCRLLRWRLSGFLQR
jgi:hypothetical protein